MTLSRDVNREFETASEHFACAGILSRDYPLRACEHLLNALVKASHAADPVSTFVSLEGLPAGVYDRTNPIRMLGTMAGLQGMTGSDDPDFVSIHGFVEEVTTNVGEFMRDVEEHLAREAAPAPGR